MQIIIPMDKFARRPVARLDWFNDCRALLDTGALFPVWTKSEASLIKLGGKLEKKNVCFNGFGGETEGQLYRINFSLKGLQYIDMPIVVKPMDDLNCHMILSATMFEKMVYTIDTISRCLTIDTMDNQIVRILRISDEYSKFSAYLAGTYETEEDYQKTMN